MIEADTKDAPVAGRRLSPGRRADLLAVGSYLLGAILLCARLLAHLGQRLPYTPGDRIQAEYFLAYAARVVGQGANPFLNEQLNAPVGVNVMANTSMYGLGLPMSPITLLFGPAVSFDLLIVLTVAGTAAAWFWLLSRHVVTSRPAAWVGGLIAGFAPSVANHATFHPNLTAQFLVPIIVWRVVRLREPGRWAHNGLVLAALVVWQAFINEETLFITALAVGLFLALYAVQGRAEARAALPSMLAGLGVTFVASLAVLAYPLWWQFSGTAAYRGGEQFMTKFHTDLLGVTSFSRNSVAVRFSEFELAPGFSAEQHGYFGWPLVLAVGTVAIWRWRDPLVRCIALTGLVFAVLSFGNELTVHGRGTGIPGPYALLSRLPLFDTLLPTRLGEVATWAVAPIAAIGLAHLPAQRVLSIGLVAAVLVPAAPTPILVFDRPAAPAFIASGEWRSYVGSDDSVLVVPLATFEHYTATLWTVSTGLDMRLSHGYFLGPAGGIDGNHAVVGPGRRPTDELLNAATETDRAPAVTDVQRAQARVDLAYWHTAIILAPEGDATAAERATLDALVGPGRHVGGLWLWDVRNR